MVTAGSVNIDVAIAVGGIVAFCAMVVFLAWLCAQGHRGKPTAKQSDTPRAHSKHTTPTRKLEEKIRQAELDGRRGDSFGSDDDGDGDGDGEGP
jgi:hypothetical protein